MQVNGSFVLQVGECPLPDVDARPCPRSVSCRGVGRWTISVARLDGAKFLTYLAVVVGALENEEDHRKNDSVPTFWKISC